ncbi:adenylate kinase 8-like isoform X2 [Branchiostoma lanceolatum]|uniref:adenylate kinase 8-like isoform X2 n=1 Tax=Branchiostoma lanceolatum TaxID=7740 RepID=UPI0034520864
MTGRDTTRTPKSKMDETKKPLRIPPQFGTYAEKHGIFDLYKRVIANIVIDKPEEPIQYIIDYLKRENDDVPQICILGPPAAGKRTISREVCKRLRVVHITPEALVGDDVNPVAKQARNFVKSEESIPVEVWVSLVKNRIKSHDCIKKGWLLEGFPQTRDQAQAIQAEGISPKHCVVLEAPDTVLIERVAGKRVDPQTGDVYHTTFDWPSNAEIESRLVVPEGITEESMVNNLVEYHRHTADVLRCFPKVTKNINADQPKADILALVLTFLNSTPRTAAPHTPRIVLLGPTGAGKSVQASLIANKYNIVNLSCGALIKEAIADETKIGEAIKPYVERGMMVPDNLVMKVLSDRLSRLDAVSRGWVMHGFPRTREQAESLKDANLDPNRVFFLDIPNDSVMERLVLRRTDPVTGERYHFLYNPPRTNEVKSRLHQHPKDEEEAVKKRLIEYHAYTEEIADFYETAMRINADQDPHTVFEFIESMIVNPLAKKHGED